MSRRDSYWLAERNKRIRQIFAQYLRQGLPVMQAYARTASDFYLSENRIRDIISGRP